MTLTLPDIDTTFAALTAPLAAPLRAAGAEQCDSCGAWNDPARSNCWECSKVLAAALITTPVAELNQCTECTVQSNLSICPVCGAATTPIQTGQAPAALGSCPNCSTFTDASSCPNCGADLTEQPTALTAGPYPGCDCHGPHAPWCPSANRSDVTEQPRMGCPHTVTVPDPSGKRRCIDCSALL